MPNEYEIEITDTFGGEANYCWVRRAVVKAKSIRGALRAAQNMGVVGTGFKQTWCDSFDARYDHTHDCICMFITLSEI